MDKKGERKSGRCHIFFGEWQAVRPVCLRFLKGVYPDLSEDEIVTVHGDDVTESAVLELLGTKDLFSPRTIVIYQEPDFLQSGRSYESLCMGLEKALLNDNRGRAVKILSRIMKSAGVSVNELKSGRKEIFEKLQLPDTITTSCLELLDQFGNRLEQLMAEPETKAGERLLQWISNDLDNTNRQVFLCIHIEKPQLKNRVLKLFLDICPLTDLIGSGSSRKKTAFLQAQVRSWLEESGKKMAPDAMRLFMEKVGEESLSALRNEVDKLIALVAQKDNITTGDVQGLVVRHKEEEVFRISDAVRQKDMKGAIKSSRLLLEQGLHPLAILSAVRNSLYRIFSMKVAVDASGMGIKNINYNTFKDQYRDEIKGIFAHQKKNPLAGLHPYVAWLTLSSVDRFSWEELFLLIEEMADLDFALKGGKVSADLVLESFFLRHF